MARGWCRVRPGRPLAEEWLAALWAGPFCPAAPHGQKCPCHVRKPPLSGGKPMLYVTILALVLVVATWLYGDQEGRTKLGITAVYLATWGLLFVGSWAVLFAQCIFCIIVGYWTFGRSF